MTNEIERTARDMYDMLEAMRKAKKHPTMLRAFEECLEAHLEELRKSLSVGNSAIVACAKHSAGSFSELENRLARMTEERDQIQQRLHAVDHAYFDQSQRNGEQAKQIENLEKLNRIAGEELIRVQGIARQHLDDVRRAEKFSDDFSEKLRDAQSVIGHQEQLIVGQRLAIAELHMAGRAAKSAVATLQRLGYTDCGGQLWKPPIGKKPDFVKDHCKTCDGFGYIHCNGGWPAAPCPEGCH